MKDYMKPYRLKNNVKKQETSKEIHLFQEMNTGFISVSVYDATTSKPVENATVEVLEMRITGIYHETGFGDIVATRETNSNGMINPPIELPVNYEEEHIGGPEYEHIHYHLRVSHEDYHTVYVTSIVIFSDITNSYRINMTPTTLERPRYEFIITPIMPLKLKI